jgi:hypothetical protein
VEELTQSPRQGGPGFFASTVIVIGDGKNTPFWESRWLSGASPKELAPNLYNQARLKHRTIHKELQHFNWIKNVRSIDSEDLLDEFVLLFSTLVGVQLSDQKDSIRWRWTASGDYSAASGYEAQFMGAYPHYRASTIWRAKTEPKCRFFAWLAIQGKSLTADNLAKKNWPCNPHCPLCYCMNETNEHLLAECNFTEAIWDKIAHDLQVHPVLVPFHKGNISSWIEAAGRAGNKKQQHINAGIVFLFWWNIWKERNRRIFENKEASFLQVSELIKIVAKEFSRAFPPD